MRIRSIKPEFWRSDDIDRLSWDARLVFIGMWSYVDDNGVGKFSLKSIAADLFAGDLYGDSTETLRRLSLALDELIGAQLICAYVSDDTEYLYVQSWDKHQRVKNPNKPRYPRPTAGNSHFTETLPRLYGDSTENLPTVTGLQGYRVTEEQGIKNICATSVAPAQNAQPDRFQEFYDAYPRKRDKQRAKKAWDKAIKRTNPDVIIAAAAAYRDDPNLPKLEFVPYPSKWLNGANWEDPPIEPRTPATPISRTKSLVFAEAQRIQAEKEAQNDNRRRSISDSRNSIPLQLDMARRRPS